MRCPRCESRKNRSISERVESSVVWGHVTKHTRRCSDCKKTWLTVELPEEALHRRLLGTREQLLRRIAERQLREFSKEGL